MTTENENVHDELQVNSNDTVVNEVSEKMEMPTSNPVSEVQDGFILNEHEETVEPDEIDEISGHGSEGLSEKINITDYSVYEKPELIKLLEDLIETGPIQLIKNNVENIKANFYKKHRTENDEKKKVFLEAGGELENFKPDEDPLEENFKQLYKKFKDLRYAYSEKLEKEKQDNLKAKYKIVEEIKILVNSKDKESINKTFQEFRDLQKRWREIGSVPQSDVNQLWETYHHHSQTFYDFIKINQELRDLDLKKNLEEKIKFCERAEELLLEPEILKAFQKLQVLHDQWREIGPVVREKQEEIWERFKQVTTSINKKHQEYFDQQKIEQENNLQAKTLICEKAEEIIKLEFNSPRAWEDKTKELVELQKLWKTIGTVPKKINAKIFMRFKDACDIFFSNKKEYFKHLKEGQNNNLQLKTELCIHVEGIKESNDWRKTTDEIISLQKKWKEIGPVPAKHSEILWKRFRAACDYFFTKKEQYFASIGDVENENLRLKNELIEQIQGFVPTDNSSESLNKLKEFQNTWTQIGHVPIKQKDDIQKKYRDAINKLFSSLKIEKTEVEFMQFRNKVASFATDDKPKDKIYAERLKILDKIKAIENDLHLWENNIGFFSKSKNAESLIKDFLDKIEKAKTEITQQKEKLRIIDNLAKN